MKSIFPKEDRLDITHIKDNADSIIEFIKNPATQTNELLSINDKVLNLFALINKLDFDALNTVALSQLNSIVISFHKAVIKKSRKSIRRMVAKEAFVTKNESNENNKTALVSAVREAEIAWKSISRPTELTQDKNVEIRPLDERVAKALKIDLEIKKLFLQSEKDYKYKAGEFYALLGTFIAVVFPEEQKDRALYAAERIYTSFASNPSREHYEENIVKVERIEKYASNLAPWVSVPDIKWNEINNLHTIWNMTHQYLIRHEIGGITTKRITVYGNDDNYLKETLKAIEESIPALPLAVIVNEGGGRIMLNIRDPGKEGHSVAFNINYNENTLEASCLLKSSVEISKQKASLKALGVDTTSTGVKDWLFIGGYASDLANVVKSLYQNEISDLSNKKR